MPGRSISVKIADIVIRVDSEVDLTRFRDIGCYKKFTVGKNAPSHCRLDLVIGTVPELGPERDAFSPAGNWQLSSLGDKKALLIGPPPKRGTPENLILFDSGYLKGTIYQKSIYELFKGFLDQFLIINLLSSNGGFLIHSSGVILEDIGICFVGPSGSGKSTLLKLFKSVVDPDALLNDDKLALRLVDGTWRVFGTPWHGEFPVVSSASADLKAIFFIKHSKKSYARRLDAAEYRDRLITQSLFPLWDKEGTSRAFEYFDNLIRTIPAFELGFLPDKTAPDFIKKTIKTI